jgi:hypothetical protein
MRGRNNILPISVLVLLSILILTSCQPQTADNLTDNISQSRQSTSQAENITLPSGFEIPDGPMPQREATYDDIDLRGYHTMGGIAYRGNVHEYGKTSTWAPVKVTKVSVGDNFSVGYRDYIETKPGQIRYNIFYTTLLGSGQLGGLDVNLKLANIPKDIQVKNVGGGGYWNQIGIMIEIPPAVKPGDYNIGFLIYINGKYYGNLPCTIHVTE